MVTKTEEFCAELLSLRVVSFIPKKEGDMEIELLLNYRLRDTFQESRHKEIVIVKRNPEIVRRYLDEAFDKLVG